MRALDVKDIVRRDRITGRTIIDGVEVVYNPISKRYEPIEKYNRYAEDVA